MKKRFLILIMSVVTVCACLFSMSACGGSKKEDETSDGGNSEQTSTWEDEDINDEEHGDIELPEIER